MKVEKLNIYNDKIDCGVDNEYPTSKYAFRQPCLAMFVGQRTSGKSYLASQFLSQAQKEKTFDRVYMITPSFNSNKAYFGKYVNEEDVYEPTRESISEVIKSVEADRDEWEDYQNKLKIHKEFLKTLRENPHMNDEQLLYFEEFMDKPTYQYDAPVKSLLILDDVINSPAISQSSGLGKLATLNRHVAPLKEDYNGRSACGLAVVILSQSYRCQQGIGRLLRENLSLFTMFKNKQEKQITAIEEEIGSVIDLDKFRKAYQKATEEKYGNLTIVFNPKCHEKTFRKNLNECIIFPDLNCN